MRFRILSHSVAAGLISLALAACSSPDEKEARYLKRGNDLFDKGQYDAARVEYKNAARLKPTDPEPPYRLGLIEEEQGNIRGAFVDFSHAEQQSAAYHPAILKIAEYYIAAEQYDEAQKRLDIVQHDTPEDPQAHALHAAILLRQKNLGDAETEAKGALAKDPINVTAYSVLTGVYNNEGDLAKANATLDEGIQHNPNDLSLLLLKARVNERTKDVPKIVEAYQTIFRLKPQEIRFRLDLATLYLKAGMTDDAEATLRAGVAAMPDNWDMKRQLVSFLGDQRSMEVAEKEVHGYMEAHPEKDDLYTWLIDIYVRHNTLDRANALLEQIIAQNRFDKQGMNARTALARVNYIKGDKEGAAKLINSVLEKDPNNPDALFMKSRMLVDKGLYRDAISDLRSILRDQPKSKEALQLLAEALFLQGHIDLAIDTLNQLLELDPTNTAARVRTAQLYHMNGDSKHAMDLLFLITKSEPGYAVAWESTARIAIDTKDWTTATTAIGTLDKLEGQHLTAVFLRAQLAANTGKPADAIPLYTQIISANPNSALGERALPALVTVYKGLNQMDEAVHYIKSLKNDSAFVNTVLGECYMATGKNSQAAAAFDRAIAARSSRAETYLDRAKILLQDHKPDQALETLQKGIAAAPADLRAPVLQGEILGALGRYKEAIPVYADLLERNPDLNEVANNLAEIIADYEYNDPAALERARQAAERFVAVPNPLLLDTLAWVYFRQGNIAEAKTTMERAIGLSAKLPPQIHYHYGAILAQAGNAPKAKVELEQAVITGANYPGINDAKVLLAKLQSN